MKDKDKELIIEGLTNAKTVIDYLMKQNKELQEKYDNLLDVSDKALSEIYNTLKMYRAFRDLLDPHQDRTQS